MLSDRDAAFAVFDLAAEHPEWSYMKISKETGVPYSTARSFLLCPERYDPYFDEVALERALKGDKEVFENLTIYEMREFMTRSLALGPERTAELGHLLGFDERKFYRKRGNFRRNATRPT